MASPQNLINKEAGSSSTQAPVALLSMQPTTGAHVTQLMAEPCLILDRLDTLNARIEALIIHGQTALKHTSPLAIGQKDDFTGPERRMRCEEVVRG